MIRKAIKQSIFIFLFFFLTGTAHAFHVSCPDKIPQGGVALVTVELGEEFIFCKGIFNGKTVYFNPVDGSQSFIGLLGVDLNAPVGSKSLSIAAVTADGTQEKEDVTIEIIPGNFIEQHLTLDEKWVDLDSETLARIERENKIITALFRKETPKKLWSTAFMVPADGDNTGGFGLKRFINGESKSSHSGIDIGVPYGTPVVASNDGIVALTIDYFYGGLSVFIDHGQGLYTMYFHLSEILVSEGSSVKKGSIIGRVGATGRVTGAHLHFAVRLSGNKVNPNALMNLTLP